MLGRLGKQPIVQMALLVFLLSGMLHAGTEVRGMAFKEETAVATFTASGLMPGTLSVMTYNIRHAWGLDQTVDVERIERDIRQMDADIVALQEVDRWNPRSGFQDQIGRLGERLNMAWAFAPSLKLGFMEYGNAILSKYPIESADVHVLPGKTEKRTMLSVTVRVDQMPVQIWTTHLGVSEADRQQQFPLLMTALEQTDDSPHGQGEPDLLMGDFNMLDSHPLMQAIMKGWKKARPEGLTATVLSGRELDHIFYRDKWRLLQSGVRVTESSDHHVVWARFIRQDAWLDAPPSPMPSVDVRATIRVAHSEVGRVRRDL
ncbi:endonuclease/exonuclease/phosphatase family protein [Marinicrinis sediminis]|uniref:Endonuclease/exonuclease/phosphatase family protein n=1 Tax=Marinicrinis sediminis TaxID=1652465 RepID=A0ABW5R730_9BACL